MKANGRWKLWSRLGGMRMIGRVAPVKNRNRMVQALGQNFVSHRQFAGGKWWGKSGGKAERKYK